MKLHHTIPTPSQTQLRLGSISVKNQSLLRGLNPQQRRAVKMNNGPLLIVAGAGTGKTTVLTKKLLYLLTEHKVQPRQVLALTFSNKAADEMEERVDAMLPLGYEDLWISTFHSFCERIIRDNALDIGLDPNFKLLTQGDTWLFVRKNLFSFDLDYYRPLGNPSKFIGSMLSHFSRLKDEDISPKEYLSYARSILKYEKKTQKSASQKLEKKRITEIAHAYNTYNKLLHTESCLDFGGLIITALDLFRSRPNILERYQQQFTHVLVDEFQDTNFAQYQLVKLLASPQNNITVTGDDNQSIYKFRGASVSNILHFKNDYPKTQEVVLHNNYRSSQHILDAAYASIQLNNPETLEAKLGISKKLISRGGKLKQSVKPIVRLLETKEQEIQFILAEIVTLKKENVSFQWNDFAILIRANAYANECIPYFAREKIPYNFVANRGLYLKPEIMDLISFLRVVRDVSDDINLFRVLNLNCFGLRSTNVLKLMHMAKRKNFSYFEMMSRIDSTPGLAKASIQKIHDIFTLLEDHVTLAATKPVGEVLLSFLERSEYLVSLKKLPPAIREEKSLNIGQFFKKIQEFQESGNTTNVHEFIDELDLMIEAGDDPAPIQLDEGPDAVNIMTIHQAKGLEFSVVFIPSMVEQRFPTINRRDHIEIPELLIKDTLPQGDVHIQEERRLFYVAMTRAKQHLYLTSAKDYGGTREKKPSRFLREIEEHFDIISTHSSAKTIEKFAHKHGFELIKNNNSQAGVSSLVSLKHKTQIPKKLSYTQLVAFENCPYQYRFAHILKIPGRGSHTFSYGRSIHKTLQILYKHIQQGTIPSSDELIDIYRSVWISDWYKSKKHENEQRDQGEEALRDFYKKNKIRFHRAPRYIEQGFTLRIGTYRLFGYIDRVDDMEDGGIEIIDYKTGKIGKDIKILEREIKKDKQLAIYALAMKRVFQLHPKKLSFYFIDRMEKLSIPVSEEHLRQVEEQIITIAKSMHTSDFQPKPNPFLCGYCDYKNICEFSAL